MPAPPPTSTTPTGQYPPPQENRPNRRASHRRAKFGVPHRVDRVPASGARRMTADGSTSPAPVEVALGAQHRAGDKGRPLPGRTCDLTAVA